MKKYYAIIKRRHFIPVYLGDSLSSLKYFQFITQLSVHLKDKQICDNLKRFIESRDRLMQIRNINAQLKVKKNVGICGISSEQQQHHSHIPYSHSFLLISVPDSHYLLCVLVSHSHTTLPGETHSGEILRQKSQGKKIRTIFRAWPAICICASRIAWVGGSFEEGVREQRSDAASLKIHITQTFLYPNVMIRASSRGQSLTQVAVSGLR